MTIKFQIFRWRGFEMFIEKDFIQWSFYKVDSNNLQWWFPLTSRNIIHINNFWGNIRWILRKRLNQWIK